MFRPAIFVFISSVLCGSETCTHSRSIYLFSFGTVYQILKCMFFLFLNSRPCVLWFWSSTYLLADSNGRAVNGVGLRPLAYWDCGFESHRGHECLSVVAVVCCQVEVLASGWSLVQRSPTDCSVSWVCDLETSWMMRPWPNDDYRAKSKQSHLLNEDCV